ncbi:BioY family protein [Nitratireductor indicus C115]|uniref:Biotin transporter n=1 Tax=Nitratireductor indicus C115 TaxID=1231190 RepID=K2NV89_9HYPH|nr:BioY family transporter [Nitratireductor indicus]EKF43240.1 BioY family protein [Nitratireductor indicus C115]SFQ53998.1 biotin transport system substrate-specific component [Nitratireductor indicus]
MERNIAQISLFAALIAALGLMPPLMMGFGVPISAQSMGVMIAGTILGARKGAAAAALLLLLVAIGLPMMSGGRGGLGVFVSPTGGFALGFPFAAWVTGKVVETLPLKPVGLAAAIGSVLGGVVTLYAFGIVGMSIVLDKTLAEALALSIVFLPGDFVKAGVVGVIAQSLARVYPQALPWCDSNTRISRL